MPKDLPHYHLAYVFERFPSFTQTFCVREILELERLGIRPLIFSIHDTRQENIRHFPAELFARVHILPPPSDLVEIVKERKERNALPQGIVLTLRHWGERPDKLRVYEAAYIGSEMQRQGVRHAHAHFAGIGARACWWMRPFYGHTFSFTGHANDIFCEQDRGHVITLDRLLRDATFVATVSDYGVQRLGETFPVTRKKVHRVYNGLDLSPFECAIDGKKSEPPVILSVGRLIEKKGFDDLINAAAILKQKGIPFTCKIAGDGPMQAQLEQLIVDRGTQQDVFLIGPKSQSEIVELLGEASIFALPCVTERDGGRDNLPTVIMEAMAAGLPCVSTNLAGVPEMIENGITGLLVDERQPGRFAAAMEQLLEQPGTRRSMGAAALQRARLLFAKEVTTRELARLLLRYGSVSFDANLITNRIATRVDLFEQWLRRNARKLTGHTRPQKRPLKRLS